MKFGYCIGYDFVEGNEKSMALLEAAAKSGFDYIETQIATVANLEKDKYDKFKQILKDNEIGCYAGMQLFLPDMQLITDDMDIELIKVEAEKTLNVAAELGNKVVVLGNGGQRRVRPNMDHNISYERLQKVVEAVDPIAGKYDVKIAIEPLSFSGEGYLLINSVGEAGAIADSVSAENVGGVCDLFHHRGLGESLKDMTNNGEKVFHLHIAKPNGRTMPMPDDDEFSRRDYVKFAGRAKQIGYEGMVSIDADPGEITVERLTTSLELLKRLFVPPA